jgi:hypothetical protein
MPGDAGRGLRGIFPLVQTGEDTRLLTELCGERCEVAEGECLRLQRECGSRSRPSEASGYSLVVCARLQCCPAKRSRGFTARQPSLAPRRSQMPCAPRPRRGWRGARQNACARAGWGIHACAFVELGPRHSFRACLVPAGCCARGRAKMRSKLSARPARSVRDRAGCLSAHMQSSPSAPLWVCGSSDQRYVVLRGD